MRLFEKELSEITWSDIEGLINKMKLGLIHTESPFLELKKQLAEFEKWQAPASTIRNLSKLAKGKISKEICAFANTDGGTLILGLDETTLETTMIKDVEDLSNRLDQLFKKVIDPPLFQVELRELTKGATDGVIIIEVTASKNAPHRLNSNDIPSEMKGQVYIRSNKSSIPVTMTHIHDLIRSRDLGITKFYDKINRFKVEKLKLSGLEEKRFIFGISSFPYLEFKAEFPIKPNVLSGLSNKNSIGLASGITFDLVDPLNESSRTKRVLRGRQWKYIDRLTYHQVYITFKDNGEFSIEIFGGNKTGCSQIRLRNIIAAACWTTNIIVKHSSKVDYVAVPYFSGKFAKILDFTPSPSTLELPKLFSQSEILPELTFRSSDEPLGFINQLLSDFLDSIGVEHPMMLLNSYEETTEI